MLQIWMVRAGEKSRLIRYFLDRNVISIGWNKLAPLDNINDLQSIKKLLQKEYPDKKKGWLGSSAGQVFRFKTNIIVGQIVITYDAKTRLYWVGKVIGDYEYLPNVEYPHTRKVVWIGKIKRDVLSLDSRKSLGAISSIFRISESASTEILNWMENI